MHIPFYQVDAFTSRVFKGNPAGICPLKEWLPDNILQSIATENNLSETAFFIPDNDYYDLRWFTPVAEVDLCGHATLASAFVLFNELGFSGKVISFNSQSGLLKVTRDDNRLALDFPARPPRQCSAPQDLLSGLVDPPQEILQAQDYLAIYENEQQIQSLKPKMEKLAKFPRGVIASAPGNDCDFVSRCFFPALGIPEDPVTGSAHCVLTPYWSRRLSKRKLHAKQISNRGGELFCTDAGDRTIIAGQAVKYLEGTITI